MFNPRKKHNLAQGGKKSQPGLCQKKRHNFGVAHKGSMQNLPHPGRITATDAFSAESQHIPTFNTFCFVVSL
jgi:hypothetical protein